MRDTLRIVLLRHLIIGFGTAVASILLIGFFTDKLTRQLDDLEFATRRIEEEDFQVRLSSRSSDEVGRLATRFNSMAKKLQELDEFRERMITTLSHDMKAPLAAMTMWTDYILKEDPQRDKLIPQHRKVLMTISADAERLRLYAMNILNAARLKGGRLKYDIKPLSLSELVPGLLTPQSMVAKQKGIELVDGVPKDLPKLLADPRHLEQAILNLLANALKFTPPGGRISVMGTADDGRVNISVVDTGKGIAPEDLKRLFQKFTQFDMPDQIRRRVEGSGLGLHIVRHSVEAMGGAVAVESKLGEGSRFTLSFPSAKENGTTGGQDVEKEDTDR